MKSSAQRRLLLVYCVLLVPVAWFAMRFDPYAIDGDAVSYMDIAGLIGAHRWAGVVNAYWHPLYPAMLLVGLKLFHPSRMTELGAYYKINFLIFLLQAVAVVCFTTALWRLRERLTAVDRHVEPMSQKRDMGHPGTPTDKVGRPYVLGLDGLRLLGLALLVIASQRELTLGKVRPDGLLQALLLFGFSGMLAVCRVESLRFQLGWAAAMGLAFSFAYLTKSFAFLLALLSVAALVLFQRWALRRGWLPVLLTGAVAFACFAVVAGPYVAALSYQKHRLDFGDSGSLNYAWYVGGTEKFHLEPWMTGSFGSSDVHLVHPERQLLASPGVYSYKAQPYGTLPPWFDASFFNERIVTHLRLSQLLPRDARNAVLVLRYLLNHPEASILLVLLVWMGARITGNKQQETGNSLGALRFALLPVLLGLAVWGIYGLVNVEERYVTIGYLLIVLPLFALLRIGSAAAVSGEPHPLRSPADSNPIVPSGFLPEKVDRGHALPGIATGCVVLLALLAMGESVRMAAEQRRQESLRGFHEGWQQTSLLEVAQSLRQMGVQSGDEVACIGSIACINDPYWMRAAGVRNLTEIFVNDDRLAEDLQAMPNREEAFRVVKAEGARVLVGHFEPGHLQSAGAAASGWVRLGSTDYFALPLNLPGMPSAVSPGPVPSPPLHSQGTYKFTPAQGGSR